MPLSDIFPILSAYAPHDDALTRVPTALRAPRSPYPTRTAHARVRAHLPLAVVANEATAAPFHGARRADARPLRHRARLQRDRADADDALVRVRPSLRARGLARRAHGGGAHRRRRLARRHRGGRARARAGPRARRGREGRRRPRRAPAAERREGRRGPPRDAARARAPPAHGRRRRREPLRGRRRAVGRDG